MSSAKKAAAIAKSRKLLEGRETPREKTRRLALQRRMSEYYSEQRQHSMDILAEQERAAERAAAPADVDRAAIVAERHAERAATTERLTRRLDEWRGYYDSDKAAIEGWISECALNPSGYVSVGYVAQLVERLIALVDKKGHALQVEWEKDIHDEVQSVVDGTVDEFVRVHDGVHSLAEDLRGEWRAEMRAAKGAR
jgi:hypothetical protein